MKLFLSSIGFDENVAKELDELISKKRVDVSIGIITNAKKYKSKEEFKESITRNTKYVADLGYSKIRYIDLDNYGDKDLECDVLYIFGGNSFYLLEAIKRSGFDKALKRIVDEGRIIVGQSAGSIIFSPSIEIAGNDFCYDQNILGLKDLDALNIVDYAILPHYEDKYVAGVRKLRETVGYDIYALKDGQTIFLNGNETTYLGGEPAIF